ncbi:MAG: glycosyltransferase [Pirellulales bacterium]|nr:glycosyltransferase [Pirellulales bacterium]
MQIGSDSSFSGEPLVSVIIPTYNRRRVIGESILSVLNQSYSNLELIVVDDGSTDGTEKWVRSISSVIRYFWQPNAGVAAARNQGLAAARGELIAFQDSDDLWHHEKLSRQVALLRDRPEAGVIYTSHRVVDQDRNVIGGRWRQLHSGWITEALFQSMFIIMPSTVVRRSVVDRVGRFSTDLCVSSDYEYWLRASLATQFAAMEDSLVDERRSPTSLTSAKGKGLTLQYHMLLRFYEELGGREVMRPAVARAALAKWAFRAGRALRREGRWDAAQEMFAKSLAHRFMPRAAGSRLWMQCRRLLPAFGRARPLDFPWPVSLSPLTHPK